MTTSRRTFADQEGRLASALIILLLLGVAAAFGQMSRKPSPTREPVGAMDKQPDLKKNALLDVTSEDEFNSIARVYHQNTQYALPHAMFVIV